MRNTFVPHLFKILSYLPLTLARGLGVVVGSGIYFAKGRSYRVTLKNIRACFPHLSPDEALIMTRESLIETAKTAAEVGIIWRNSWTWLQSKILEVEGEDLLHAELAKGRGLIALAPHLGNWEVIAPYLASHAALTAMYQPVAIPAMDKMVLAGRSKSNINMAPTNLKGVCKLLKALQQGDIVGILPDQLPKKEAGAELASFFGQEVLTMSLVYSLINRTQSPAIALFAKRIPGGFKIIILPPDQALYSDDILTSLGGLNRSVENCVHLAPVQYQWEYNRFRLPKSHQLLRAQKLHAFSCKKQHDS